MGAILFLVLDSSKTINKLDKEALMAYNNNQLSHLLETVENNLTLIESNQRGFVISGDEKYLEDIDYYKASIITNLDEISMHPFMQSEKELIDEFRYLIKSKIDFEDSIINEYQSHGEVAAIELIKTGQGFRLMKSIIFLENLISDKLSDNSIKMMKINKDSILKTQSRNIIAIVVLSVFAIIYILLSFRDINIKNKLEDDLIIARNKSIKSAELKEQFMANMSHEIRTPMNAILGFTNLLEKTSLNKTQSEYISAIKLSGSNLLNIINDILDFSKIESDRLRLENISFSIPSLMDSLELMFAEKAKEKNLTLTFNVDEKIPKLVAGDPVRLTQIMVNLIGNAIKFTHKGNIDISSIMKNMQNNMVTIVYKVKDTGIGIQRAQQDEIFERFSQGSANTTRQYGGTGLGLAIVKKLVELQEGSIQLKSKIGEGSEFTIEIKYQLSSEKEHKSFNGMSISPTNHFTYKPRLLLVEDNLHNQKYESVILKEMGLEVDIAENGQLAIEMLQKKKYHLVIMDIQMPIMDGYKASTKIRQELQSDIPIIAMTAHVLDGEREKCLSFGMNDYISKPFKEIELFELINKYIGTNLNGTNDNNLKEPEKKEETKDSIVKLDELNSLAKGNQDFVKDMIEIFLNQTPADMKQIETAIKNNNAEQASAIAHKMKTSVGFIGLKPLLDESLIKIESLGKKKEGIDEISKEFKHVKSIIDKAIEELKQVLKDNY